MPYIDPITRVEMTYPQNAGELNYEIALVCQQYLLRNLDGPKYQDFNDVSGVLRLLASEIEQRFVRPYEDSKITENGEVFVGLVQELERRGIVCG